MRKPVNLRGRYAERFFAVVYVIVVFVVVVAIQGRSLFGAHQRETKDYFFVTDFISLFLMFFENL